MGYQPGSPFTLLHPIHPSIPGVSLLSFLFILLKIEQIARTKVFFMIYRKFLRPRELLEMFIERFEELKEFAGDEDEEARNTRLRYERKKKG